MSRRVEPKDADAAPREDGPDEHQLSDRHGLPEPTVAEPADPEATEAEAAERSSQQATPEQSPTPPQATGQARAAAAGSDETPGVPKGVIAAGIAALGVVFGDIGTSPLYALKTVFTIDSGAVKATESDVYGVVSLMFWSITIIVSIKYVGILMRADNNGEGGVMALAALAQRLYEHRRKSHRAVPDHRHRRRRALLRRLDHHARRSAVCRRSKGCRSQRPRSATSSCRSRLSSSPASSSVQRFGTGKVGNLFGPVMVLWFAVLAVAGLVTGRAAPLRAAGPLPHVGRRLRLRAPRRSRSSRWARSCWSSPARRRSTRTWATSAGRRSAARGSSSCSRR